MKILKFTDNYTPYKEGDVASFSEKEAEEYLKAKVAVEYKKETAKEVKAVEKPEVNKKVEGATVAK